MQKKTDWSNIKTIATARGLNIQYLEYTNHYEIFIYDYNFELNCRVNKEDTRNDDQIDFEDNYKAGANQQISQIDTDGAFIFRMKAAKKGWSFWANAMEITTSTLGGSLYNKDSAGNDIPGVTCKIYDGNDDEITTAGLLNANLATCVKTVLDFEMPFDVELVGGALRINSNPAQDIRLWVIGAPDIPANLGGSKEFASGINLKFLAPDSSFEIDGRVTKFIAYDSVNHTGKMRLLLKHGAGVTINLQFVTHTYRL